MAQLQAGKSDIEGPVARLDPVEVLVNLDVVDRGPRPRIDPFDRFKTHLGHGVAG